MLRRLYALSQRPGGQLPYHLPQSFWIDGPLDIDKVEDCFSQIIRRYESLRARFVAVDGEPAQCIVDEPRFSLERYAAGEDRVDEIIEKFLRPFDLAVAPLLRVGVVAIRPDRHLLIADAHHIAVDGLSLAARFPGRSKPSRRRCVGFPKKESDMESSNI